MKFDIRLFALVLPLFVGAHEFVLADAFDEILRTAALKNGLRPAAQLFDDRDANLAPVGKVFFESENVSLNGKMACRTCHLDEFGSVDGLSNAVGVFGEGRGPDRAKSNGLIVPRNTLPLWGRGAKGFDVFFWDGRIDFSSERPVSQFGDSPPSEDALTTAVHLPPVEIREMLVDDNFVESYRQETRESASVLFREVLKQLKLTETTAIEELGRRLNTSIDELSFLDVARSIAAFIRSEFRLKDTKFHRFVFGTDQLTSVEREGGLIFYGKGKCVNCHHGSYFSDLKFHAIPFPQLGFGKNGFGVDYGRFNVTFESKDLYQFRTPPLINVSKTAPYGHSGSLPDIESAIRAHFDPLQAITPNEMGALERHEFFKRMAASGKEFTSLTFLSDEEIVQLQAFLSALTID